MKTKKAKLLPLLLFITSLITAQGNYDKGMEKAFSLWTQGKNIEASNIFERISKVEKDNWLPSYYVATVNITASFGLKEEKILKLQLDKAQKYLDMAFAISKKNPELIITQALLNTAYIAFDGQKYGMTLGAKNSALYQKAFALAPNNPRVVLGKAEWEMGSATFFGQSTKPFCSEIKRAIELFKKEKTKGKFYPSFGLERAPAVLKRCEK